jgi:AAHS family benzoate transporter-like MFS transporter
MTPGSPSEVRAGHEGLLVVAICFLTVIFDGYDLIVYGAVVPSLLDEPGWHLTPGQAGAIGSWALVGMLIGALGAGALTDIFGRRKIVIASMVVFSTAMAVCGFAGSPEMLGVFRFVAGLGLGGVIPSAVALTVEYAPHDRRQLYNAVMFTGYSVGGVLAAVLALALVPGHGWRVMFWLGAAPLVLILPLALAFLPESAGFLLAKGRTDEAERMAKKYRLDLKQIAADNLPPEGVESGSRFGGFAVLFRRQYLRATLLFGGASFCGLLLVFGLNTWLPQIMRQAGYPLGSALQFLLALNVGAIVGTILVSTLADRFGSKPVIASAFVAACVALLLLSQRVGGTVSLLIFVAFAGLGSVGVQILINGFVAVYYPATSRASALGWNLSSGRLGGILGPLLGGWIMGAGAGFQWNFYVFAVPALLGAAFIVLIPRALKVAPSVEPSGTQETRQE